MNCFCQAHSPRMTISKCLARLIYVILTCFSPSRHVVDAQLAPRLFSREFVQHEHLLQIQSSTKTFESRDTRWVWSTFISSWIIAFLVLVLPFLVLWLWLTTITVVQNLDLVKELLTSFFQEAFLVLLSFIRQEEEADRVAYLDERLVEERSRLVFSDRLSIDQQSVFA